MIQAKVGCGWVLLDGRSLVPPLRRMLRGIRETGGVELVSIGFYAFLLVSIGTYMHFYWFLWIWTDFYGISSIFFFHVPCKGFDEGQNGRISRQLGIGSWGRRGDSKMPMESHTVPEKEDT